MNLVLLEKSDIGTLLPPGDRRVLHIGRILKKKTGGEFAAGILTEDPFGAAPGSLGTARIESLDEFGLRLIYEPEREAPPLRPLRLLLGFPRPIQGGRLLKDLATLGVADIILCGTELGEKSYLESDLWKKGEYRRSLHEGAEQAGNPRIPRVSRAWSLRAALAALTAETARTARAAEPAWNEGTRICLHPGGASRLRDLGATRAVTLAIGSERGWTQAELAQLAEAGFSTAGLGDRILKTETAAISAVSIILEGLGYL